MADPIADAIREFRWWNYGLDDVDPNSETAEWVPALAQDIRAATAGESQVLRTEVERLRVVVRRVISVTQDTDGVPLDQDTDIPVGEVVRMLYEFDGDVTARAVANTRSGQPTNEPGE